MTIKNGKIFILTKINVLSCSLSLNPEPVQLTDLETNNEFYQIAADNDVIYINANNSQIIKFELGNNSLTYIDIDYSKFCNRCGRELFIKTIDNRFHFLEEK